MAEEEEVFSEGDGKPDTQEAESMMSKLGVGERLLVLGAEVFLAVWLLFDLLIDEYAIGSTALILGLIVAGAAYVHHNGGSSEWGINYTTVVVVAGALLGVLGAWDLIEEVRGGIFDRDAATVIGGLAYYASSIACGVGAWQLSRK